MEQAMQVKIRPLQKEEQADAIRLSLDTFTECGKNDYDDNGLEVFNSFIHDEGRIAELSFLGAFHGEKLVGVLAFRQRDKHISLFFVHPDYHRKGVGRKLFGALADGEGHSVMTVNSSTYAVPFYESLGFTKSGATQNHHGLVSVPMKRKLEGNEMTDGFGTMGKQDVKKSLEEMTLEELWQLFPIVLTAHREEWAEWYGEEAALLQEGLQGIKRISHIGSTAIKGIWAKPTIDILVEVSTDRRLFELKGAIERCGYLCMAESRSRIDFNKGYTPHGFAERVFHLHLRYAGDNDELYFRDYLSENAAAAKEYEQLKLDLWKRYEHDRDAYTAHKSDFIRLCTEKGKRLFGNKYHDEE